MSDKEPKAAKQIGGDKITLSLENSKKVQSWLDQAMSNCSWLSVSKTTLVNWQLSRLEATLSERELGMVKQSFASQVAFARWIYLEARKAAKTGDQSTVSDLFKKGNEAGGSLVEHKPRQKKKTKEKNNSTDENKAADTQYGSPNQKENTPPTTVDDPVLGRGN